MKSSVNYIDHMGTDEDIVQAARTSYGDGTTQVRDVESLIRFLMRKRHTSPFEMCELKVLLYCPIHVFRQWVRHRTANVNEYSTRFSVAINDCENIPNDGWRLQDQSNKQGSQDAVVNQLQDEPHDQDLFDDCLRGTPDNPAGHYLTLRQNQIQDAIRSFYDELLASGVSREQARNTLTLGTYTRVVWKCDLHNILHFLKLRTDPHAQKEIRELAEQLEAIVKQHWPLTHRAWLDYVKGAVTLSALDILAIRTGNTSGMSKGEYEDYQQKCEIIGLDLFTEDCP